jgi:hypothetical protein
MLIKIVKKLILFFLISLNDNIKYYINKSI